MELTELQSLAGNFEELKKKIAAQKPTVDTSKFADQYNPIKHEVNDTAKRPDKVVQTDQGTSTVPVTRLSLPMQKRIVNMAATFLTGNPVKLIAIPADEMQTSLLSVIQKSWDDNKLDYESKTLAKLMMSQTEVAEIWYTEQVDPVYWAGTANDGVSFRLRMKILSPSLGDILYPVFNMNGDMIAFGRTYFIQVGDKKVEHFDLYTETTTYLGEKSDAGWSTNQEANVLGKIPIIYYSQDNVEWADVQQLIDRLEKLISNHGDTNDYYGSPMVKVKGEIKGFAKKGEQGKVLELMDGAEADYMTWDQSPESLSMEYKNLRSLIFDLTDTPDISFEQMKGLGTYSGVALKMLFLGAHMKASDKEEIFGKCIQRRINFIKAAMARLNVKLEGALPLSIKPRFEYYLPKNDQEIIDMLMTATGNKPIISQKTAVSRNPLVDDPETEIENIKQDQESASALNSEFNA